MTLRCRHVFSHFALVLTISLADVESVRGQNDEAEHEALRGLRAVAEQAINDNQLELLKPYLNDPFSVVTYTDREFSEFEAFKDRWQKTRDELLNGGSYTTDLQPERSLIIGDIAIARGNSANTLTTGDGRKYEFPSRWTAVLRKMDGQWKIVRAHSSLSPFDNPMMKDTVKRLILKVGAASVFVGLVLGWLANSIMGRWRTPRQRKDATSNNASD